MLNLYFIIVSILLLMGCSAERKSQGRITNIQEAKLNVSSSSNAPNKIVFLTFHMIRADSTRDTYLFNLTNTIFANGTLNKNLNNEISFDPYYLYCEITDDNEQRVDLIKVQNPLLKVLEYSPDKQLLEKKIFTSNTGELYLRFQLSANSKYLTIYKPQPGLQTLKKIYHAQI